MYNIQYEINYYTPESIDKLYYTGRNLPIWFSQEAEHIGEKCYIREDHTIEYTLIGLQETNEDYYYILKDPSGKVSYETCLTNIVYE